MAVAPHQSARAVAAEVLTESRKQKQFAGEILDRQSQPAQSQRATDLVFGVIRNRDAIDLVIEKVSGVQIKRIPDKILDVVRVAFY
jgi:transcription termination factor NusB